MLLEKIMQYWNSTGANSPKKFNFKYYNRKKREWYENKKGFGIYFCCIMHMHWL